MGDSGAEVYSVYASCFSSFCSHEAGVGPPSPHLSQRLLESCRIIGSQSPGVSDVMKVLERIRTRAAAAAKHIVLPEGEDPRTLQAAAMCIADRLARITLIGPEEAVRDLASANN